MSAEVQKPIVIIRPQVVILCQECEIEGNTPMRAAVIINGVLIVDKKPHHGRVHPFKVDVEYIKRLLVA